MMKQLFLTKYPVFIFGILISLCSFINPDKITTLKKPGAKANALLAQDSGKLNILWAPATDFKKLTGKTIFNFSFSLNDSITLHGWHTKGVYRHTYGGTTNVRLFATNIDTIISDKKEIFTSIKFGKGTYFGNLLLYRSDLKQIRHLIASSGSSYVLFVPKIVDEHVYYDIALINEEPALAGKAYIVLSSSMSVNPSPPKKYN